MYKSTIKDVFIFEGWELRGGIWVKFYSCKRKNLVVTQGLNEIQSKFWTGSAYTAALYVGLITTAGFTALAATDTAAQIGGSNGWTESVAYSESVRQTLTMGVPTAGALDNSAAKATFTVTSGFTLKGGFVVTSNVKAGTGGKIIGESLTTPQVFTVGQQVKIIISSTLASA